MTALKSARVGREAYARREASPLGQRYPLGNPLGRFMRGCLRRFPPKFKRPVQPINEVGFLAPAFSVK
ncbi:MAG: hypothetical protein QNJ55_11270 [Xenococcus sp. MO_188.B8]|nr:hypothetical protein [Xenococcus sp. MO_188.B8]